MTGLKIFCRVTDNMCCCCVKIIPSCQTIYMKLATMNYFLLFSKIKTHSYTKKYNLEKRLLSDVNELQNNIFSSSEILSNCNYSTLYTLVIRSYLFIDRIRLLPQDLMCSRTCICVRPSTLRPLTAIMQSSFLSPDVSAKEFGEICNET